jgi:hypothetical protein
MVPSLIRSDRDESIWHELPQKNPVSRSLGRWVAKRKVIVKPFVWTKNR